MSGLQSVRAVMWTYSFLYVLSTTFLLKITDFKMYLVVCGNFRVSVYKETESQEIAWTFTGYVVGYLARVLSST